MPDWSLQDKPKLEIETWWSVVPYRHQPHQWMDLLGFPESINRSKKRRPRTEP